MPGRVEGPAFVFAFAFRLESLSPSVPVFLLPAPCLLAPLLPRSLVPCLCHPERVPACRDGSKDLHLFLHLPLVPSPSVPVFLLLTPYSLFPVFVIPSEAFFSGAEGPAFVFRPQSPVP